MFKTMRNVIFVLGAFFSWGIVGSIELERITLGEGTFLLLLTGAVCAAALLVEFAVRAAKILLTVYAIRRKKRSSRVLRTKRSATV